MVYRYREARNIAAATDDDSGGGGRQDGHKINIMIRNLYSTHYYNRAYM